MFTMTNKKATKSTATPKRMKKYRMDKGLTIYDLAKRLGVDHSSICNWENGQKYPRRGNLMALEDVLEASYRELFEDLTPEEIVEIDDRRYKRGQA